MTATTLDKADVPARDRSDRDVTLRSVTAIGGVVIALTFLFGFGNVLNLALRLGVPAWVAPLIAPAVDLSILGLLLGTRHLALTGASAEVLKPARRLLIFASVVTIALNVADPLVAGEYGKAAFDAVGPLLLIGWSDVGPGLLQAISTTSSSTAPRNADQPAIQVCVRSDDGEGHEQASYEEGMRQSYRRSAGGRSPEVLLELARQGGRNPSHSSPEADISRCVACPVGHWFRAGPTSREDRPVRVRSKRLCLWE